MPMLLQNHLKLTFTTSLRKSCMDFIYLCSPFFKKNALQ